jgi:2-keto-4-pentenoate hydratase/2-oxohepta-3-ene-1,7-dioic acid hydratase in catechol pathway
MASAIDLQNLTFRLWHNEAIAQEGNTADMIFPVTTLLQEISKFFSLIPGDVIMTGTPKGVGPLVSGDRLRAELDNLVVADAVVDCFSD